MGQPPGKERNRKTVAVAVEVEDKKEIEQEGAGVQNAVIHSRWLQLKEDKFHVTLGTRLMSLILLVINIKTYFVDKHG